MVKSGIYQIRNKVTGKVYIGSAVDFVKRFNLHLHSLRNNKHHNPKLQNSWNKHSSESFEFIILEHVENKDHLLMREQHWINWFGATVSGYNILPTAGSHLGAKRSDEAKKNLSKAKTGIPSPLRGTKYSPERLLSSLGRECREETRVKISNTLTGKKHSQERIMKNSNGQKGKVPTDAVRAKLSSSGVRAWKSRKFRTNSIDICTRKSA